MHGLLSQAHEFIIYLVTRVAIWRRADFSQWPLKVLQQKKTENHLKRLYSQRHVVHAAVSLLL